MEDAVPIDPAWIAEFEAVGKRQLALLLVW